MGKNKNKNKNQSPPPRQPAPAAAMAQKPEQLGAQPPGPELPGTKSDSLLAKAKGLFQSVTGTSTPEPEADSASTAIASLEARLEEALEKTRLTFEACLQREQQASTAKQDAQAEQVRLAEWEQKLKAENASVQQRLQALEQRGTAVSEQETWLQAREAELKHSQGQLLREREALRTRELNAEAGFAEQRRHSLEQLEREAQALHQQLSEQRERISSERAAWEKERTEAREKLDTEQRQKRARHEDELQKEATAHGNQLRKERAEREEELRGERAAHDAKLRDAWNEHESALREARRKFEADRAQFEEDKGKLTKEQRQLQWDREDLKDDRKHLEERAQQLAARQVEALQHVRNAAEERLKEAQAERDRLTKVLAQREEVDRRFGHMAPEEVLTELQELRGKRTELEQALAARPSTHAAERLLALETEKDQWEQARTQLYQENQSLKHELSRYRMGVVELETIRDQKAMLESSRNLLQANINELRKDVDDRIRRSDGRSPFPSLSEMDATEELQNPQLVREELPKLDEFVHELQHRIARDPEAVKAGKKLIYPVDIIRSFLGGVAMSPLLLLQGISGTGKTTLPLAFARAIGAGNEVIEVQAGWRDKHDLIGHFNAFERRFYEEPFLRALYRARCPKFRDVPFLIVLDEMNLSHPEQYFADLLSAMEREAGSQKLHLMTASVEPAPHGLEEKGKLLPLPPNVWFVGTANHDETTKEFAPKTYDRAHVMEFDSAQHQQQFEAKPYEAAPPLSLQALRKAFAQAKEKHADQAKKAHLFLRSELSPLLKERFRIGMSNRLERQLMDYVPVIIAAGGTLGEAVDHILATKLLRGLRNQHDTRPEDLIELQQRLLTAWAKPPINQAQPKASLKFIKDQLKRLGAPDEEEAA
ncbi:AAA family ATPase [Myxococcus sp. MxC21-1]|uniref:AAA family ATPase n=1 Tax=Myxococcus sp. MxC21-1 TaxID=3041439 RepID=UPI00292F9093|nr:AAA family ATPase [Myxococcus sp. MxC21-1]WNZ59523.1 AAA family ATPase [Myxococcus sp. MxC21-1]